MLLIVFGFETSRRRERDGGWEEGREGGTEGRRVGRRAGG